MSNPSKHQPSQAAMPERHCRGLGLNGPAATLDGGAEEGPRLTLASMLWDWSMRHGPNQTPDKSGRVLLNEFETDAGYSWTTFSPSLRSNSTTPSGPTR